MDNTHRLAIIKLGGSIIAPKNWESQTLNFPIIQRICNEISQFKKQTKTSLLVIVGSGNFAHAAVKKFGIDTPICAAKVQVIARGTGSAVTDELLNQEVPATLIAPHDIWHSGNTSTVIDALSKDLVPVLYGDVIWEKTQVASIFSGETCIANLIPDLIKHKFTISTIIHAGAEDGVFDAHKNVVPEINSKNWNTMKNSVSSSEFVDVTGGMLHKVTESLALAQKYHIETMILNGNTPQIIYKSLRGEKVPGTQINP